MQPADDEKIGMLLECVSHLKARLFSKRQCFAASPCLELGCERPAILAVICGCKGTASAPRGLCAEHRNRWLARSSASVVCRYCKVTCIPNGSYTIEPARGAEAAPNVWEQLPDNLETFLSDITREYYARQPK